MMFKSNVKFKLPLLRFYSATRLASPSLDPMAGHACGMTVDEEERRHIFVVYNKRGKDDVDTDDDGSRDAIQ